MSPQESALNRPDSQSLRETVGWLMERVRSSFGADAILEEKPDPGGGIGFRVYRGGQVVAKAFPVPDGCWSISLYGDQHA